MQRLVIVALSLLRDAIRETASWGRLLSLTSGGMPGR